MGRILKNQSGNMLVGTVVVMVVLATASTSLINLSGSDIQFKDDEMQGVQAMTVGNGGLQWALGMIENGRNPVASNRSIGTGSFTITTDPANSIVVADSRVGRGRRTQSVTAKFAKDCVDLDVTQAYVSGSDLENVYLIKKCNDVSMPEEVTMSWDWGQCALGVRCECEGEGNGNNNCPGQDACAGGEVEREELGMCATNDMGAMINEVEMDDSDIFRAGAFPDPGTTPAQSGEEMALADVQMINDTTYVLTFRFNKRIADGAWFDFNAVFADQSEINGIFKVYSQGGGRRGGPDR